MILKKKPYLKKLFDVDVILGALLLEDSDL
jgi:hypothetical protein